MLTIRQQDADEMIAHSLQEDPNECCGILAGHGEVVTRLYRITNIQSDQTLYLMDPQEFLDADRDSGKNGWKFLAFYHSHVRVPAFPSETDVGMAMENGWLGVRYVLVSLESKASPQIRAFNIGQSGDITEEELRITDA
ncbi:MAG: M67 family metallopeptidase [Chloroflexi bacterium]|nr:M67 family metallopeptidase [Chloroflexota bacterium]